MKTNLNSKKSQPSFALESEHSGVVAGIDEAGCGPWAGPVVASACILHDVDELAPLLALINDSKMLTVKKRDNIFEQLIQLPEHQFCYSVGMASVEEIDKINIGKATRLAMERAVNNLSVQPAVALIDGIRKPILPKQQVITVVKGDQKSYSIAAASIIAKVTRDRLMTDLDREFPMYGWSKNAGYGTVKHQTALKEFGVTAHHRRSFAPIAKLLNIVLP